MRYQADVKLLSSVHRLPGVPSSFAGLDNYTGNDMSLQMEDWLGDQEQSAHYLHGMHVTMERKLGL